MSSDRAATDHKAPSRWSQKLQSVSDSDLIINVLTKSYNVNKLISTVCSNYSICNYSVLTWQIFMHDCPSWRFKQLLISQPTVSSPIYSIRKRTEHDHIIFIWSKLGEHILWIWGYCSVNPCDQGVYSIQVYTVYSQYTGWQKINSPALHVQWAEMISSFLVCTHSWPNTDGVTSVLRMHEEQPSLIP